MLVLRSSSYGHVLFTVVSAAGDGVDDDDDGSDGVDDDDDGDGVDDDGDGSDGEEIKQR